MRRRVKNDSSILRSTLYQQPFFCSLTAVAPKNIYNLNFDGIQLVIPDVTDMVSFDLGTDVIVNELFMSIALQSILTQSRHHAQASSGLPSLSPSTRDDSVLFESDKRQVMKFTLSAKDLSIKPDTDCVKVSEHTPILYDGSACALIHRLEPAHERDTVTKEFDPEVDEALPAANMLELSFVNFLTSNEVALDNRAEVDLALEDLIIVALPTQLAVTLKGVEAILACPTLAGKPQPNASATSKDGTLAEGFFEDDESDASDWSVASECDSASDFEPEGLESDFHYYDEPTNEEGAHQSETPRSLMRDLHTIGLGIIEETEEDAERSMQSTVSSKNTPQLPPLQSFKADKSSSPKRFSKDLSKFFGADVTSPAFQASPSAPVLTIDPSVGVAVSPLSDVSPLPIPSSVTIEEAKKRKGVGMKRLSLKKRRKNKKQKTKSQEGHNSSSTPSEASRPTNGTIFNGAALGYTVRMKNISVALLLHEKILESGLIDINITDLDLTADSDTSAAGEQIKFILDRLTARGCSLDGSTQQGSYLRVIHLPFKSAIEIGPLNILYKGYSRMSNISASTSPHSPRNLHSPVTSPFHNSDDRHSFGLSPSETFDERGMQFSPSVQIDGLGSNEDRADTIMGTVFVSIEIGIGSIKLNLTPSLNAVFSGCIAALSKVFALSEEETKRLEAAQQRKEEEEAMKKKVRFLNSRRQALRHIWKQIDTDASDSLDQNEVKKVVLCLLERHKVKSKSSSLVRQGKASQITTKELERELVNFMHLVDANHDNNVSFQELEDAMFKMKNSEEDGPNQKALGVTHGIVYFSDLKEFNSPVIVYEITGVNTQHEFPPPVKWTNPDGIETFFKIYMSECGCSRNSLNRQDAKIVQRKLVRVLQSYDFAKFCWESLIEAGLIPPSNMRNLDPGYALHTRWLLEGDRNAAYNQGAIDILASHVQNVTLKKARQDTNLFRFDTSLVFNLESALISAGNALIFSKSLLNIGICDTKAICRLNFVPDSEDGFLNISSSTSEKETEREGNEKKEGPESDQGVAGAGEDITNYGLSVHLETRIYVECLNTTHGVMGMIIEPWSAFLSFGYDIKDDDLVRPNSVLEVDDDDDDEIPSGKRTRIGIKCPDFLKIDFTPETLRTLSILQKMIQITPEVFEKLSIERNIDNLREFWLSVDENDDGLLDKEEVIPIVKQFFSTSWQFMPEDELNKMVETFIIRVDLDGDGCISYYELEQAVRSRTMNAKSIFESSSLIRIHNTMGYDFYFGSVARNGDNAITRASQSSNYEDVVKEIALDSFDICHVGRTRPLKLGADFTKRKHHRFFRSGDTISLKFQHFRNINNIQVPAFQKVIFPLSYLNPREWSPASRFLPTLTIAPVTDPLETVSLTVRSSFIIQANTPICVEIYKVKSSPSRGLSVEEKMAYCLQKAEFVMRLDLDEGENAGIPLNVVLSKSLHFLRIRDEGQSKWRNPVIFDRDFLWNLKADRDVSRAHARVGINVVRKQLINEGGTTIHRAPAPSVHSRRGSNANAHAPPSVALQPTKAWDTAIRVLPSIVLSSSLPFNVQFHCFQKVKKGYGDPFQNNTPPWSSSSLRNGGQPKKKKKKKRSNHGFGFRKQKNKTFKFSRPSSSSSSIGSKGRAIMGTSRGDAAPFNSKGTIKVGSEVKLTGVDLNESLWISISREDGSSRESNPIELNLKAMSGGRALPTVRGNLEDEVIFKVSGAHMRNTCKMLNIFSPYWVVNKTGMSLQYEVSGREKSLHDTTLGSAPVLVDSGDQGRALGDNWGGNWIRTIPNQGVYKDKLTEWWNVKENGPITARKDLLNCGSLRGGSNSGGKGISLEPDFSEKIGLDNVGQIGEINCGNIYFGVSVETMTGAFQQSNLMTFYPRFVVRNKFKADITIVPLEGNVKQSAKIVDRDWKMGRFKGLEIIVKAGEASVVYSFSKFGHASSKTRFIALRTTTEPADIFDSSSTGRRKASIAGSGDDFTGDSITYRTHIIPVDQLGTLHFCDRMGMRVGEILRTKNTKSGASTIITLDEANGGDAGSKGGQPPYRIENRSTDSTIVIMQDDDDAEPIMLGPMNWCSYAYDNPHGTLRIRSVALNNGGYGYVKDKVDGLLDFGSKSPAKSKASVKAKFKKRMSGARRKVLGKNRKERILNELDQEEEQAQAIRERSESDDSSMYSNFSLAQSVDEERFKTLKDRRGYVRALWGSKSRRFNIDKVGRRKNLPSVNSAGKKGDDLQVECKILRGTKVVSFNDSSFRIEKEHHQQTQSGGDWRGVAASIKIKGIIVNLIDSQPQEVLSACLREIMVEKVQKEIDIECRLGHLQIDNMRDGARFPIILQPADDSTENRKLELLEKERRNEGGTVIGKEGNFFWQHYNHKPRPLLSMYMEYLPLQNMTWIPELRVFLNPLILRVDLAYVLGVVDIVNDAIGDDEESPGLSTEEVELAYMATDKNMEKLVGTENIGQLAYVGNLNINETFLSLDLFLRQEVDADTKAEEEEIELEEFQRRTKMENEDIILEHAMQKKGAWAKAADIDQSDEEEEDRFLDDADSPAEKFYDEIEISNLSTIGRGTNSTIGASMLTWLTNVASSFASINPTFTFKELDIHSHFGQTDELSESIARHYVTNLLYQSYKLFSFHLLGDPFSLLNSITSGAMQFITITRDELMAKGRKGYGGGVKKLVQGVVGGTTKSTAMVFGSAADIVSQVSGNGAVMDNSSSSTTDGPKHLGEGLIVGGAFFGKHLLKGIVGVLEKPVRGARKGPMGMATGMMKGVGGLAAAPFVATFGGVSKVADSIDATTHMFDYRIVNCRVRPRRNFGGWGSVRMPISVPCIKGIGIRIHNLQYITLDSGKMDGKKKIKIIGADGMKYNFKGKKPSVTYNNKGESKTVEYTVLFEDTIVVRSKDLQVYDELRVEVWDKKLSSVSPLAITYIKIEELLLDIKEYNDEIKRVSKSFYAKKIKMLTGAEIRGEEKARGFECINRRRRISMGAGEEDLSNLFERETSLLDGDDGETLLDKEKMIEEAIWKVPPSVNEHILYSITSNKTIMGKLKKMQKDASQSIKRNSKAVGKEIAEPVVGGIKRFKHISQRVINEKRMVDELNYASEHTNEGGGRRNGEVSYLEVEESETRSSLIQGEWTPWGVLKVSCFPVEF